MAILEASARLAGCLFESDYSRVTLAIREMTVEEALEGLEPDGFFRRAGVIYENFMTFVSAGFAGRGTELILDLESAFFSVLSVPIAFRPGIC